MNLPPRDRILLALLPACLAAAAHIYWLRPRLQRELDAEVTRLEAAKKPVGDELNRLRAGVGELREQRAAAETRDREISDRVVAVRGEYDRMVAETARFTREAESPTASTERPADVFRRVGQVLEKHGLSPRSAVSEPADRALLPLLTALSGGAVAGEASVRRLELIGKCKALTAAVLEISESVPAAVPLSLEIERDPGDGGATRRMTLWLWF